MLSVRSYRTLALFLPIVTGMVIRPVPICAQEPQGGVSADGLQAILSLPESKVAEGENLSMQLELRNISGEPLSLYKNVSDLLGMPIDVKYSVRRGDGSNVEISQVIDDHTLPPKEAYMRLQPGKSLQVELTMRPGYADPVRPYRTLEPGVYTLELEVHADNEGRITGVQDAWIGTVKTNPVRFEVLKGKPHG